MPSQLAFVLSAITVTAHAAVLATVLMRKRSKSMAKNWIKGATKNKGGLHRSLGVPEGKKIPAKKVEEATHSENPKIRKEAILAQTLGKLRKH